MAEYGVVLAVITLVVVVAITTLSGNIKNAIDSVSAILP
jgi:Flp pilus assembly pilin Flp